MSKSCDFHTKAKYINMRCDDVLSCVVCKNNLTFQWKIVTRCPILVSCEDCEFQGDGCKSVDDYEMFWQCKKCGAWFPDDTTCQYASLFSTQGESQ